MIDFSNIVGKLDEMIYKPNNLFITNQKDKSKIQNMQEGYSS